MKASKINDSTRRIAMRSRVSLMAATLIFGMWLATPVWAGSVFFSTGSPDGRLGALSRRPSPGKIETETADDFVLQETTVITQATITGLVIPLGTPLKISNVEVELYHVFPLDSDVGRTSGPPTFSTAQVPTRVNSPADVEIASATRDGSSGTLRFFVSVLNPSFTVANTVVNGIFPSPHQLTHGEGPATGAEVEITIMFTNAITLPAGHYFFRPEVLLEGGDFLYLSAPRPIVSGTPFPAGTTDLQAWIRNSDLAPDWLRIGTDIIGGTTFNMTFSLLGSTFPEGGKPE